MSTTDFSLPALVREICDRSDEADPAMLAKAVNHQIAPADRDAALEQSLKVYVRWLVSSRRHSYSPGGQIRGDTQTRSATGGTSSAKVAGIRAAWRAMLRDRIPAVEGWKFLGACTVPDLNHAAEIRDKQARDNAHRAAQLRTLAALLEKHGVTTVGELPDDVLGPALEGES